jgi:hypothetical protein
MIGKENEGGGVEQFSSSKLSSKKEPSESLRL